MIRSSAVTTVGHSFAGLSFAALTLPPGHSRRWYALTGLAFVFFANLPDFPLPGWGHNLYYVSHSVFVTVLLASALALLLRWSGAPVPIGGKVVVALSAAWLSHMVLDSMYSHGQGIAIFWPFSDAHLALPVPWFDTVSLPVRSEHNRRVLAIETMVYGAVFASALGLRQVWFRRRCSTPKDAR